MRQITEREKLLDLLSPPGTGLQMGISQRGRWGFYRPTVGKTDHTGWNFDRPLTEAEIEFLWPHVEAEKVSWRRGPTAGAVLSYLKETE